MFDMVIVGLGSHLDACCLEMFEKFALLLVADVQGSGVSVYSLHLVSRTSLFRSCLQ